MGATILIPRLAFNLMSENMLFVSLRAMVADFAMLTVLAVWCFVGFLLSMIWLGVGRHSSLTVSKWMLWVWFGLDGTGIGRSPEFHWLLGPILMITFAFLGYLFLVILVSMLSTTFSSLVNEATTEIAFRRAVLTLEGVKGDAIFLYYPPLNLFALCVLVPLKFIITPRWFHKINVALVRTFNLPTLLLLAFIERRLWWAPKPRAPNRLRKRPTIGRRTISVPITQGFSAHGDISAVFQAESDRILEEQMENETGSMDFEHTITGQGITSSPTRKRSEVGERESPHLLRKVSRRDSMLPHGDMADQLRAILSTADDESESGGGNFGHRIHVLEDRLKHIEDMLEKLLDISTKRAEQS